jgi:hypothetical protein
MNINLVVQDLLQMDGQRGRNDEVNRSIFANFRCKSLKKAIY